jgi:hypothetical protein
MQFRRSVSGLLTITLLSSCNLALANGLSASEDVHRVPDISRSDTTLGPARSDLSETLAFSSPIFRKDNQDVPLVENYLVKGKLRDGETALLADLKEHANNDQSRFGLGVLQFLRAVEQLMQDLYRYGLRDLSTKGFHAPFFRLPAPSNPRPQTLTYHQAHKITETLLKNLTEAEATLTGITDAKVKLPLHFGMIRLDLNGDGRVDDGESLWKVYADLSGNTKIPIRKAEEFLICFDRGDVHWLRGYCHVLMAMCEVYLAHDSKETFDCTAHMFFAKVQSPFEFLSRGKRVHLVGADDIDVVDAADLIALIHLIRWPVVEPKRMEAALHHLEAVVVQSKESWKWIMAETDDDHEWLPNPSQTGVIPNVTVTEEMVTAWSEMMDQADKLLAGNLLIPFWRGDDGRGINVRKVFLEPRTLDLVLWVQGSAAAPYLQKGEMTKSDTWRRLPRVFGSNFPGFAAWFN